MKNYIPIILFLFVLKFSCKNELKNENVSSIQAQKVELPVQKGIDSKNQNPKKIPLTKAQLEAFFPDYIGSNKRYNVYLFPGEPMATASYGSFESSYNYSIYDAARDHSVVKNFEMSFNAKQIAPEGTEYVLKERDGYKTIAFLQPNIKRYDIRFVYNNRFRIVLEGPEHSDALWSYIKKEDLEKLNNN
ncbi:hypothetical protein [Litoribaculum gwangyangense]|uniref:Lipoprotein n=1 Tax=Litoribaculum gwangyangense TaxID=1130722 RepID=A0ABP9C4M9_9FLAO